ncbi:conserved hypothetical protein [Vibrio chagasii]|nr:conserved hypothetical protein [Vibrio chagasii]
MSTNIFISFYAEDAEAVLEHTKPCVAGADDLFNACLEVREKHEDGLLNGDSMQFNINFSKEVFDWCHGLVLDELDHSGIFADITRAVLEKRDSGISNNNDNGK